MEKTDPIRVGDLIRQVIETEDNLNELDRQKASYIWSEIVGAHINQVTTNRYVQGDVLHVYISSGIIKSELAFFTDPLRDKINQSIGRQVITKIIIH